MKFKFLVILCFNLVFSNLYSQEKTTNKLIPFEIQLYYGDEGISYHSLNVYEKNGEFFAKTNSPYSRNEINTDSIWLTKLNNKTKKTCLKFINDFKQVLKKGCNENSSALTDYTIIIEKDTLKLSNYCDLDEINFNTLINTLFEKKIKGQNRILKKKTKQLKKLIIGKWYYSQPLKDIEYGQHFFLSKDKNLDSFFIFGNNYSFKNSNNTKIHLEYSKTYELEIDNGNYLKVNFGAIIYKDGSITIGNSDMYFLIIDISKDEIRLMYNSD